MNKIASALAALILGAGVAACGTSNSTNTNSSTAPATSSSSQRTTQAAPPASQSSRMLLDLRGLVAQMSAQTGRLASPNSSSQQSARTRLGTLQRQATTLAGEANRRLPAGSPAQTLVSQLSGQISRDAGKLQQMKVTTGDRQRLRYAQATLNNLSAQIGRAAQHLSMASPLTITKDVQRLARELGTS